MKIRGAPLIGAAAAYALALTAVHSKASSKRELFEKLKESAEIIQATRPTGVNLFWAIERILNKVVHSQSTSVSELKSLVVKEAQEIADEDVQANRKMGEHGSKLIADGNTVLTHCNAGALATVDYGTALGVIRSAWEHGRRISVIATETRPKLQGTRLTAYELKALGIPFKLITDNMVGYVMSRRIVDLVIVGADRILRDAVVNKIGTYSIAVLAHEHEIPFYVAAPISTFDFDHTVKDVIIEERNPDEVTRIGSRRFAPRGITALNPAFDITPMKYVTKIICEKGVLAPQELQELS
jgi:methylthioribose-1-phosphate isomerase